MLLLLLFLCRFTALAEAVLNVEIFLLRELQLVAKGQEDAFTLQDWFLYYSNIQFDTKCVHPSTESFANALQSSYNHWYNLNLFQRPKPFQLSLFKFWYFSTFPISFSRILQSPGTATSMMTHHFTFLSTKIKSGLLASITLSHWMFISQVNLTSSSFTTPSGQCSYRFSFFSRLCFSQNFQWTNFPTVSCLLLYSRCAIFLHSDVICSTVSPLSLQILYNGFSDYAAFHEQTIHTFSFCAIFFKLVFAIFLEVFFSIRFSVLTILTFFTPLRSISFDPRT